MQIVVVVVVVIIMIMIMIMIMIIIMIIIIIIILFVWFLLHCYFASTTDLFLTNLLLISGIFCLGLFF